jgi:NADH dehydrogenase
MIGGGDRRQLSYDHLVLALGSVTNFPPVPGLREHGFEMKDLGDAVRLRDRAIQQLELAESADDPEERRELLHFVVVGGNYTGVELAGEFLVFLRQASRFYRRVRAEECEVTLIELRQRILPNLDENLAEYARGALERRGIRLRLGTSASEIHSDRIVLRSGEQLRTRTVLWCAGVAPPPLLGQMPFPTDQHGYIVCDRDLRVKGFRHVWAIGDCSVNIDRRGRPYPATAQHAVREGHHLARNLSAVVRGRPATPCDIDALGSLAALGCRTAVAKVLGVKLSGFSAWFLWRTVYLTKMPGLARRVRVALDWTLDLIFRRSYVQLGLGRKKREQR